MAIREVKTTEDVYETFGQAFVELTASPVAVESLGLDLVIQYVTTDPDAVITASLGSDVKRTDLGATDLDPDVVVRGVWPAARSLLLGELNPFLAMDRGELSIEGNVGAFLAAVPVLRRTVSAGFSTALFGPLREPLSAEDEAALWERMARPALRPASG